MSDIRPSDWPDPIKWDEPIQRHWIGDLRDALNNDPNVTQDHYRLFALAYGNPAYATIKDAYQDNGVPVSSMWLPQEQYASQPDGVAESSLTSPTPESGSDPQQTDNSDVGSVDDHDPMPDDMTDGSSGSSGGLSVPSNNGRPRSRYSYAGDRSQLFEWWQSGRITTQEFQYRTPSGEGSAALIPPDDDKSVGSSSGDSGLSGSVNTGGGPPGGPADNGAVSGTGPVMDPQPNWDPSNTESQTLVDGVDLSGITWLMVASLVGISAVLIGGS